MRSLRSPGILFAALAGLLVALYGPMARDLTTQWWEDPNYSHGFLVPVFSGYVLWQMRHELARLTTRPSWLGLPVLVLGIGVMMLGIIGAENFLSRVSFLIVVAGLVLFHLGAPTLRAIAFPLGFLLFMIPLPQVAFNAVAFPLQTFAAENAASTLDWIGIPVLRDGNVIHLSRLTLGVTEACSGIRSLISLLAVSAAWAHLSLRRVPAMLVLVASTIPITIVANAARIVATGLVARWFGHEYAEGFFHGLSGWLIFLVAFAGLLGVQTALATLERTPRGARGEA